MPRRIRRRTPSPINLESDSDDESFIVQDDHLSDDELTLDSDHTESETDPEDDFEYTLGEFPRTRNVRAELDSGNSSVMSSNSPDTLVDDDRQQPGPSRMPLRSSRGRAQIPNQSRSQSIADEIPAKKVKTAEPNTNPYSNFMQQEEGENNACPICFEAYKGDGNHRATALKCGHLFGKSCIERWIRDEKNNKCPACNSVAKAADIRVIYLGTATGGEDSTQIKTLQAQLESIQQQFKVKEDECSRLARDLEEQRNENVRIVEVYRVPPDEKTFVLKFLKPCSHPTSFSKHSSAFDWNRAGGFVVAGCDIAEVGQKRHGILKVAISPYEATKVPTHDGPIRCIKVCPSDDRWVASIGDDKILSVQDLSGGNANPHRLNLRHACWTCCWESFNTLILGMRNGQLFRYRLGDVQPEDISYDDTDEFGAINNIFYDERHRFILIATAKGVYIKRNSFTELFRGYSKGCHYDLKTNCFLLTIPAIKNNPAKLQLYQLEFGSEIKAVKIRDLSLGNTEKMLSSPAVAHFWLLSTGHLGVAYNSEMKGHTRFFNWGMLDDTNGLEAKALNQIGMFKDLSAEGIKQYGYFERETQPSESAPDGQMRVFAVQTSSSLYLYPVLHTR